MRMRNLLIGVVLVAVVAAVWLREAGSVATRPSVPLATAPVAPQAPAAQRPRVEAPRADDPAVAGAAASDTVEVPRRTLRVVESGARDAKPIPGAQVTVEQADGTLAEIVTGADGRAELPPGVDRARSLTVFAPGRVRRSFWSLGEPLYPPDEVRLEPGSPVSGRVVAAAGGAPLAEALVVASQALNRGREFAFIDRATTDSDGRFTLPGVPRDREVSSWKGPVRVQVSRAGFVSDAFEPVSVRPGETEDPMVIALVADAPVEGVVLDADGSPVAGATIHADDAPSPWGARIEVDAVSGDDGRFRVGGLRAGTRVSLRASSGAFAPSAGVAVVAPSSAPVVLKLRHHRSFRVRVVAPGGGDAPSCAVEILGRRADSARVPRHSGGSPIDIGPIAPDALRLLVSAPGAASALLSFDEPPADGTQVSVALEPARRIEGVVTDDAGRPVADAQVSAGPPAERRWDVARRLLRVCRTDERGKFLIECAVARDLLLDVGAVGHVRRITEVRESESPLRVELVRLGAIETTLLPPTGASVPGYCGVYLTEDAPRSPLPPWEGGDGMIHPNGSIQGRALRIEGLPPGRYALSLRVEGFLNASVEADVVAGTTTRAPDVRLDAGLSVTGQVLDLRGRPLPGVRVVSLGRQWESGVGDTDETGRFVMGELLPGRHTLAVTTPGMEARLDVDVRAGVAPVTIQMRRTRRVRVRLVDADGVVVTRGAVRLEGTTSLLLGRRIDGAGNASFDLLPGSYEAIHISGDHAPSRLPAVVVPEAPEGENGGVDIELHLEPAAHESGPR